ncbi:MAG: zf-HC2 domain-containing protein [Acidimicrobiia bacterium]
MQCSRALELMSAGLDGELDGLERSALDEHLDTCRSCQAEQFNLATLHRSMRVRVAEPIPDLTARIMAKAHPPSPGRFSWVRYALAVLALTQMVLALPALVLGEDPGASVHVARHIGSLTVAMAIGLAYAAWRPVRAFGLLPMVLALGGCIVVTSILDIADGQVSTLSESQHLLDLAGVVLLWMLAGRPMPRRHRRAPRPSNGRPHGYRMA